MHKKNTCGLLWYPLYFGKPVVNTLVWKGIDSFNKYSDVQDKKDLKVRSARCDYIMVILKGFICQHT